MPASYDRLTRPMTEKERGFLLDALAKRPPWHESWRGCLPYTLLIGLISAGLVFPVLVIMANGGKDEMAGWLLVTWIITTALAFAVWQRIRRRKLAAKHAERVGELRTYLDDGQASVIRVEANRMIEYSDSAGEFDEHARYVCFLDVGNGEILCLHDIYWTQDEESIWPTRE
jgi:hypothetical protein